MLSHRAFDKLLFGATARNARYTPKLIFNITPIMVN